MKHVKDFLFSYIQRKSPYDYEEYVQRRYDFKSPTVINIVKAWKYIIKRFGLFLYNEKCSRSYGTESQEFKRKDCTVYIDKLMKYDVIAFDMFHILILRRIIDDSDIYHLIGMKLGINSFREIRKNAEIEAKRRFGIADSNDINMIEIYRVLHEWYDIDVEESMKVELGVEKAICVANPYWYCIFDELIRQGKKIVIITDTCMSQRDAGNILKEKGYVNNVKLYVSCELNASKRNGKVYEIIKNEFGSDLTYVHIGSEKRSNSILHGWDYIYYKNVHEVGRKYRHLSKSIVVSSVVGGIKNVQLHNGIKKMEPLEEFGYNYFGEVHVGYCQWLERFAQEKHIDKFLFVSRDGYLLHEIYKRFYGSISSEYIYISRFAISQVTIVEDMEMFIQQNIEPKVANKQYSIGCILEELGLQKLKENIQKEGLALQEKLDRTNLRRFKLFLYNNRSAIEEIYKDSYLAAEKYYAKLIENCERICVVDVGWLGTCTRGVTAFLKKHLKWSGDVYGAHIGVECGKQNIELFSQNRLNAYVFTPDYNCRLYHQHDFGKGNVINEIVFSAPEPSLYQYKLNDAGQVMFEFLEEPIENVNMVIKIQRGVWRFVDDFCGLEKKMGLDLTISAESAYQPILGILKKRRYVDALLGDYVVNRDAATIESTGRKVRSI